uniref:NADH-ubiquinone oxidoreductase chain 4 n=1 Tax=Entelurus aequoreus TaxID=161455 RepID=A0A6B9SDL7_9TELE|nr:NADH dehydrogenase subunit 4 [Entelurus aequoreus]
MLKVLIPTMMLLPTVWLTPFKWLWPTTLTHSLAIALTSLYWMNASSETGWTTLNQFMATDPLSTPLLVLSCWLLPLMVLASQNHLSNNPPNRQRTFITLLITLQTFLILAFSATELIMFYVMFEATLIPTILIITRWGNQAERLNAGTYFLFYTLAGSMPLLVALLMLQNNAGSLSMFIMHHSLLLEMSTSTKLLWAGCLVAFLVKMPLYGIHLWLPKAHVEAPIAGSMVLAAVLLKLGGYGMIRLLALLDPLTKELAYPFIIMALWGVVMAGSICLRQTDLKSMIAYSSVSHMGLVAAAILIQTSWAFKGAMILMIAHGLTSSVLFCLANFYYERTHTRTLLLARGMQVIFPFMGLWWLVATVANLALPPLPNFTAELLIITSLFKWSPLTILLAGAGVIITAAYSLYLFLVTQRGPLPKEFIEQDPALTREHLISSLTLLPLVFLIFKPHLIWGFKH